jgi:mediator of RNA polymerase II transcription subunit 25
VGFVGFLTHFWFQDAKIVNFQWGPPSDSFESLSKVMSNGFAGCVHFTPAQCDVKILILLYMPEKKSYYGFIPNDQNGYVERLRRVIQQSKGQQMGQNPVPVQNIQQQQQQQGGPRPMMGMGQQIVQQNPQGMNPAMGQQNMGNMQGQGGDGGMMFNQQMQMQGGGPNMVANQPMNPNQQRMARPQMMQNNLRHLLQQVRREIRFHGLVMKFLVFCSNKTSSDLSKWAVLSSRSSNSPTSRCTEWIRTTTCFRQF